MFILTNISVWAFILIRCVENILKVINILFLTGGVQWGGKVQWAGHLCNEYLLNQGLCKHSLQYILRGKSNQRFLFFLKARLVRKRKGSKCLCCPSCPPFICLVVENINSVSISWVHVYVYKRWTRLSLDKGKLVHQVLWAWSKIDLQ